MPDVFSDQLHGPDVPNAEKATGRALVPLTLSDAPVASALSIVRPDARFVTHLIATAIQAPQTRNHRRAPVEDAVTRYADAGAREKAPQAANGAALSRVA